MWYYITAVKNALVAQLDRVTGYEPVGRGFESLQARQVNRGRNLELKNETFQIPASFSMRKPSVKAIFRGLSLVIEMGHQKAKSRKTCCKNNQMYLF